MSGGNSVANKIAVLQKIKAEEEILFGAFTNTLTKQDKTKKWTEVKDLAQSLGIAVGKDWTYVRDTIWGNWRKRTIEKEDNASRTGTGGGSSTKYTEMDNLVLDILGKDKLVVVGLGQADSFGLVSRNPPSSEDDGLSPQDSDFEASNDTGTGTIDESPETNSTSKRRRSENSTQAKKDEEEAKKRKLQLQNYKLRLEILQLERNLQIPRSQFTENFPCYPHEEDAVPSYKYL